MIQRLKVEALRSVHRAGLHVIRHHGPRWSDDLYKSTALCVNIGAGSFYHPRWTNLDAPNPFYRSVSGGINVVHDLTGDAPLPFVDSSVDLFYCSHVLEHLRAEHVARLLDEIRRCLRPAGTVRIVVPDAAFLYRAYRAGDTSPFRSPSPWGSIFPAIGQRFAEYIATDNGLSEGDVADLARLPMNEFLDALCARAGAGFHTHREWYEAGKLVGLMRAAGLAAAESRYLQSTDPRMRDPRLFDCTVPGLSLFAEGTRQ